MQEIFSFLQSIQRTSEVHPDNSTSDNMGSIPDLTANFIMMPTAHMHLVQRAITGGGGRGEGGGEELSC